MKNFFHRLKIFFQRIERIERKSYTFYSNSPQILHLLAIFSGDTSTRGTQLIYCVLRDVILFVNHIFRPLKKSLDSNWQLKIGWKVRNK